VVADRACLFPTAQENESFAAALAEICRDLPVFTAIRIEGLLSAVGPGFALEAEAEVFPQKMRTTVWYPLTFSKPKRGFDPQGVEEKVREILVKWADFCSKWQTT
jgi:hypothetical protein